MKYYDFELDENKNYYMVIGGRGSGKKFHFLNDLARKLCELYHFNKYSICEFGVFYSIELRKYKGSNFCCSVTIMKDQFKKMGYDELTHYIVEGIRQEVEVYDKTKG